MSELPLLHAVTAYTIEIERSAPQLLFFTRGNDIDATWSSDSSSGRHGPLVRL